MKKKLLCILLAMLLCLSIVLVSCDEVTPNDPAENAGENETLEQNSKEETPKINVSKCKATVVKYLKENGQSLIENTVDPEELASEIEQIKLSGELTVDMEDEKLEEVLAMKDGLLYLSADGEEKYILLQDMEVKSFSKDENGVWSLDSEDPEESSEENTGEDTEILMMMLTGVNFQKITQNDIRYKNEKFIVNNKFLAEMLMRSMMESMIGDAELSEQDKAEMETAIAEGKAEFLEMFNTMQFELAFRATETEVTQIILSLHMDSDAMREMGTIEEGVEGHVKVNLSVKLSNGGRKITGMSFMFDFYEEDVMDSSMNLEIKVKSETLITLEGTAVNDSVEMKISGKLTMNDASDFPTQIPEIVQGYMK